MTTKCVQCDKPLPPPARTGRPRRFCSTACARLAEFAIRRHERRLSEIADALSELHVHGGASSYALTFESVPAAIAAYKQEHKRLEAQLRRLLTDETQPDEADHA